MAFAVLGTDPSVYSVVGMPSRELIATLTSVPVAFGPSGKSRADYSDDPTLCLSIRRQGDEHPWVKLGLDAPFWPPTAKFTADGTRLVWGNDDGTVTVADLREVQRRLAALD